MRRGNKSAPAWASRRGSAPFSSRKSNCVQSPPSVGIILRWSGADRPPSNRGRERGAGAVDISLHSHKALSAAGAPAAQSLIDSDVRSAALRPQAGALLAIRALINLARCHSSPRRPPSAAPLWLIFYQTAGRLAWTGSAASSAKGSDG